MRCSSWVVVAGERMVARAMVAAAWMAKVERASVVVLVVVVVAEVGVVGVVVAAVAKMATLAETAMPGPWR